MRLACAVIPRFPLAVELLSRPDLLGQAVVLGGAPEERKVVIECSPLAEQTGIRRGMALREALSRCRDATFLEAHPTLYATTFARMMDALETVSPVVEGAELGCAFVDLTGLPGRDTLAGELALAEQLLHAVHEAVGLRPRVGVADGRFAAWAAAVSSAAPSVAARRGRRAAAGAVNGAIASADRAVMAGPVTTAGAARVRVVAPGEAAAFLAALPVHRLPLSDEMQRRLRWLGIRRIGELAAMSRGALAAQFGPEGGRAWDLARGAGGGRLIPRRQSPEVSDRLSFPLPVVEMPAILAAARHLLGRLLMRPQCAGRAVRGVALRAHLSNGHDWQRVLTFHEPTLDRDRILRTLAAKLSDTSFSAAVEELEVSLRELCSETGVQQRFGFLNGNHTRALDTALEQIRTRFGRPLIMKIVGVEPWSRLPERQYAMIDYTPSTILSP